MKVNYHTHTTRCHHAHGTEREYIEAAIARGLETLGFSDHGPMPFPPEHNSYFRMGVEDFPEYMETLLSLREEYRGRIEILIGLEVEYYPAYFGDMLKLIAPYPVDYLILGQHFTGNEIGMPYPSRAFTDEGLLAAYTDQVIAGMQTGAFSYLAHPDLPNFVGDEEIHRRHQRRLIRAAMECGLPLEFNLLGFLEGRQYPSHCFFALAAEEGAQVLLGCDAHAPGRVAVPDEIAGAEKYLAALGIRPLDRIPLRPVPKCL